MSFNLNRANSKQAISNIILVANAFVWYLIAFNSLKVLLVQQEASSAETLTILGANTGAIAIAGLVGTFVVGKLIGHRKFLFAWIAIGIVLSLAPLALDVTNLTQLTILSVIFGTYFGIGMPATMGYHAGLTKVENRAKIGGLTFLIIGVTFAFTSILAQSSLILICALLMVVRIIGLTTMRWMGNQATPQVANKEQRVKYREILSNRSFIFYFIPWLMFTLINYMTIPIQNSIYPNIETYTFLAEVEFIVTAIVAVISGFVADKIGRKRLSIIGFVMLGVGYAIIGLATVGLAGTNSTVASSTNLLIADIVFLITDGTAWGIFYVLFLFTLWGDIAQGKRSDKFYFLGALPYVSAYFMQILFKPFLDSLAVFTIFSFASFFLFLAVLPLIYAPETLPEKLLKDRELKSYVESAKKKAEKDAEKARRRGNVSESEPEPKDIEETEANKDNSYEEARKLAEKYY